MYFLTDFVTFVIGREGETTYRRKHIEYLHIEPCGLIRSVLWCVLYRKLK